MGRIPWRSVRRCSGRLPAGLELCEEDIQKLLDRRKPGQSKFTTPRKEADKVKILSGVFEGKTTGTPISMVVFNTNQRSGDYSEIAGYYRPGHADYTFDAKYGFRDYRGGGRSSARETIGRVAAGAIALKILESLGITLHAYAKEIGGIAIDYEKFDLQAARENAFTSRIRKRQQRLKRMPRKRYRRAIQSAVSLSVWLRA